MADAQELLEQVTPGNRLISKLQLCMKDLDYPGVTLSHKNKVNIQALKNDMQQYIDQLTARREWIIGLVKQIPDLEAQLVLQLRYGLFGMSTTKKPWNDMPEVMHYEIQTIYRRHRTGIDYLNEILEKEGVPEWHVGENATSKN